MAYEHVTSAELRRLAAEVGFPLPPPRQPQRLPRWLIAACCGALALLLAASLSRRGRAFLRMRPRLSRPSAHGDEYLEASTLVIVAWCAVFILLLLDVGPGAMSAVFFLLPVAGVVYGLARCRSIRTPLADWGWRRGRGIWIEVTIGALAGLASVSLRHLPGAALESFDSTLWTHAGVLGLLKSVVWAPITEETLYRGMLYRHVRDWARWPIAVLLTAAVFAAAHTLPRFAHVFVGGLSYALLREWRGSLLAPVAAHATHNLVGALLRPL